MFTTPHDPREFLQLFNPLASAHYTRGVVTDVRRETADTATISFRAGEGWASHRAGQWANIGVEINGRRLWRPYSISAGEGANPSITVRSRGTVSRALVEDAAPGSLLYLERPAGQFLLEESPTALLFLTAGSGITPVMSMLRTLMPRRPDHDVILIHLSSDRENTIFHDEILELSDQFPGFRPHFHFTSSLGRLDLSEAAALEALCPDFRERTVYTCGPDEFVSAVEALAAENGASAVIERFDTKLIASPTDGPGEVILADTLESVTVEPTQTILEACEAAGRVMRNGCRTGLCRSCVVMMTDGAVSNLRTGELVDEPGMIQTCITRPAPSATLDVS